MAKMNLNDLSAHSDEVLNKKIKTIKMVTWIYVVIVVGLFGTLIYDMMTNQRFNMFIVVPVLMLINFYLNYTYIKKIKAELTRRTGK